MVRHAPAPLFHSKHVTAGLLPWHQWPDIRKLSRDKQSLLDPERTRLLACVRSLRTYLFATNGWEL